jgi:anaerobic selenocysteine-containing dehydrogenase/Fe-S-cluster-containing dehydrogenase component
MSDSPAFNRRDFLKLVGIGAAGAATGCASRPAEKLIPYLVAPNDILPGIPYYYASTCNECPAGCGVLVKTREGRAIKVEGNPAHPVNEGKLCGRGQASMQGLYDPDRVKSPMVKEGGTWKAITWDDALKRVGDRVAAAKGGGRIALVTANATGSFEALAGEWTSALGGSHLVYEPFSYESVREANRVTFGRAAVPQLDFARAKMAVSFGADFLNTFGSPVAQARGFAAMRSRPESGRFVTIEPRLSASGSSADEWVPVRPGGEMAVALAMVHVIQKENLGSASGVDVSAYAPEAVQQQTDVPADTIVRLARAFAAQRPSLAVAGGVANQSEQSVALLAAVNLLNHIVGNVGETVRFDRTLNHDAVATFSDVQRLIDAMAKGQVQVLLVHDANPAYAVPAWAGFGAAMDKVPFKVSLSGVLDETAEQCDLLLPSLHALESWGDAQPMDGVTSIRQPSMQRVPAFDAHEAGDTLIALAKAAGVGAFPDRWLDYLKNRWKPLHSKFGSGRDFDAFWTGMLEKGGVWEAASGAAGAGWASAPAFAAPVYKGGGDLMLVLHASPSLGDGRGANKSWLQELPDPVSSGVWNTWAEIHPETAGKLGVATGDPVDVATDAGRVTVPAYLYSGIRKDVVSLALGQGHTAYGRYAKGRGVNALTLLGPAQDAASGALAYQSAKARVTKAAGVPDLALTQIGKDQAGRGIGQVIPVAALLAGSAAAIHGEAGEARTPGQTEESQQKPGKTTEPRALAPGEIIPPHAHSAYEPDERVRHPRAIPISGGSYSNPNSKHRWAMAIDLNSCNGCQACVVACYAENNIPTVGPAGVKHGRDMAWLRIERWEEKVSGGATDVRFVPMLCQQCSDAPCEIVCPVYATYHNPEGLNAQVYNRCVGTRYCSNNCPYKVRVFNWFDYSAPEKATFAFPEPLNWQLNPDVTVRSKGVMEKCTFCVQRILEGKGNARDEKRPLRDGEIQTACSQSCPTDAIVFGDLLDPASRVAQLSEHGERRYWVLNELNTKPGITYLKKIERETEKA